MLKTQKLHLQEKRALFFSDDDLEETILIFENEIERVQNCLRADQAGPEDQNGIA